MEKKTNYGYCRRGGETEEKRKKAETEVKEKTKTEGPRDVETKLLIMEYPKNAKLDSTTLKVLEFWGGEE